MKRIHTECTECTKITILHFRLPSQEYKPKHWFRLFRGVITGLAHKHHHMEVARICSRILNSASIAYAAIGAAHAVRWLGGENRIRPEEYHEN